MTNTIAISFLSELRYINNENTIYENACRYRQVQCPWDVDESQAI